MTESNETETIVDPGGEEPGREAADDAAAIGTAAEDATDAEFDELEVGSANGGAGSLAMLYDLSLPVSVQLGRTTMTVQQVLALGRGSVIQLDRLAGEPIDVFVGDRRFAEGEVVVIGEQFGIRITRIVAPQPAQKEGGDDS